MTQAASSIQNMDAKRFNHLVFSVSLGIFFLCGLAILVVNYWTQTRLKRYNNSVTKQLWKFVPESNITERRMDIVWGFRKLILVGVALASLFNALICGRIGAKRSGSFALLGLLLWMLALVVAWYFYVIPQFNESDEARKKQNGSIAQSEQLQKKIDESTVGDWKSKTKTKSGDGDARLPVTVITGFLGAGKTTLVKGILGNTKGIKILVIENEIGNEGIDHELLMQNTQEEIILMDNGCVCCTVRKDLLVTFHRMFENEAFAQLDWVVIETTGLADPAPLIQSLYMDALCQSKLRLDGVLTVVDTKHLPLHLAREQELGGAEQAKKDKVGVHGGALEARLQLAFADRVLLNKVDLVSEQELQSVKEAVAKINPGAGILVCGRNAAIGVEKVLNIRAFDGTKNDALLSVGLSETDGDGDGEGEGDISISRGAAVASDGDKGEKLKQFLSQDANGKISSGRNKKGGGARRKQGLKNSDNERTKKAVEWGEKKKVGKVVSGVSTLSLTCEEPLDMNLFNSWITSTLQTKGPDIYRMKGILNMAGYDQQFVAHGVHMVFDGERSKDWPEGSRRLSRLVFIGLNLNHELLTDEFFQCREGQTGSSWAAEE